MGLPKQAQIHAPAAGSAGSRTIAGGNLAVNDKTPAVSADVLALSI
jgi:hypothetical protein